VSNSEYDEIAQGMEEAQAELEREALEEELPNKRRQTERARALKKLADSSARLRELERRRRVDSELADALTQMNKSTKQLLAAINANTKTTNDLLAISNARLAQLEQEIVSGDTPFPADPRVLAEGEFLKAQLSGIQGTEEPRPLFKDAPVTAVVGGFDLITSTVCATCNDGLDVGVE
jgi:hypothetical protein